MKRLLTASLIWLASPLMGCFSERSFPMRAADVHRLDRADDDAEPADTRAWLRDAHARLKHLMPGGGRDTPHSRALLTEELALADGEPLDVSRFYGERFDDQHKLFSNFFGLLHTAQSSGADPAIETEVPPWDGFEDVWVPIDDRLRLSGRLGLARDERGPIDADCIVIMPGLLGDLAVERSKQLAIALRATGHHVLVLELRGYGQTERRYGDVPYHFGVMESGDLLVAAEWLQSLPHVRRTGLVGFCWGANHALLAAWEDGRDEDAVAVDEKIRPYLRPRSGKRHWEAGVVAFSPCLKFEEIIEATETEHSFTENPVLTTLQNGIRFRKNWKHHPDRNGRLRTLIDAEFAEWNTETAGIVEGGLTYLRFFPHHGKPAGDKLEAMRVPVLIVHGRNDPLANAQDIADCMATVQNRNVAAMILPGGGHVGFAAWSRPYFYSLIVGFFDPKTGPSALP